MSKSTGILVALGIVGLALLIRFLPLVILAFIIWVLTRENKEKNG